MTLPAAPRPWLPAWFWYLVAAGSAAAALLAGTLLAAVVLRGDTLGSKPVLVEPGRGVDLPARNYLADRVGLYGVLPPGRDPGSLDLGCRVGDIEGVDGPDPVPPGPGLEPLRVGGRLLQPVATIPDPGLLDILTCDGPDLQAVAPVYAVGTWDLLRRGRAVLQALLGAGTVLLGAVALLAVLRGRRAARLRGPSRPDRPGGTVGPVP